MFRTPTVFRLPPAFRVTVSLSIVLGLGALAGGVLAPAATWAAPEQSAADPVADWDKQWQKALKESATDYGKLAKKYEQKLEATSAFTLRYVLRYLPDDEDTRDFLGYAKSEGGGWMRVDTRRDVINEMSDLEDPKGTKYGKEKTDVDKKVATRFRGLAKKAVENGAAKDASAEAKWPERAASAWERVLEVEGAPKEMIEEAHKELKHPKFENKSVSPFKFKFMQARTVRKKLGEKEAGMKIKPVDPVECDGMFVSSGLQGGGGKSTHFLVNTTLGKDVAMRLVASGEKALLDVQEVYGFHESFKDRLPVSKFNIVKDTDEFRKLLEKGFEWKPAEVQRFIDRHFGGLSAKGESVGTNQDDSGADDRMMNCAVLYSSMAAQQIARADLGTAVRDEVDDWLWQGMGYDVTKRVNGTALTHWGAFGRYGESVESTADQDKWMEIARRQVMTDDDIPLDRLAKCKLGNQDFKGQHLIKSWAFLQFLFESDTELARKFVWHALANGTGNAAAAVYPDNEDSPDPLKSMEKIDAAYREWILKAN